MQTDSNAHSTGWLPPLQNHKICCSFIGLTFTIPLLVISCLRFTVSERFYCYWNPFRKRLQSMGGVRRFMSHLSPIKTSYAAETFCSTQIHNNNKMWLKIGRVMMLES